MSKKKTTEPEMLPSAPAPEAGLLSQFNPEANIEAGRKAAQALMGVIEHKPKPVIIRGERYLEYEDWQTLGKFFGLTVETGEAEAVKINGVDGAKATATIYNASGLKVGGAQAYCMRDEESWRDRPWFMLASMAQTRAGAKALRNQAAWVAVLAGCKATPAEEMEGVFSDKPKASPKASPKAEPTHISDEVQKAMEIFQGKKEEPVVIPEANGNGGHAVWVSDGYHMVRGTPSHVTTKEGVGKKGPWTRIAAKIGDKFYSTFDEHIGTTLIASKNLGHDVVLKCKQTKFGFDVVGVEDGPKD